jgi:hypothetical protein
VDGLLDLRHARHTADEEHLLDVPLVEVRVLERLPADVDGALDEVGLHKSYWIFWEVSA